jgi:chorismate synthase
MLRFLTAGESHGPSLTGILEGMPAGLNVDTQLIDLDLVRRQGGYGRSGRQKIEKDHIDCCPVWKTAVRRERPSR